jgi:hypothetical protein
MFRDYGPKVLRGGENFRLGMTIWKRVWNSEYEREEAPQPIRTSRDTHEVFAGERGLRLGLKGDDALIGLGLLTDFYPTQQAAIAEIIKELEEQRDALDQEIDEWRYGV